MSDPSTFALFDVLTASGRRRCCTCRETKPFADFGKHSRSPLGLNRQCRICHCDTVRRSRVKNFDPDYGLDVDGNRTCKTCGIEKPLTEFPRRSGCIEGRSPVCKSCYGAGRSTRRRADLPAAKLREAAYRDSTRKKQREHWRAYRTRSRLADPEACRAKLRAEYWSDPERARARNRAWHATNKEASRIISTRRTARRRAHLASALVITFTREQFDARMAYWGDRCYMCAGPWGVVEHVKPISAGGAHCLANLRPACTSCNSSKGAKWRGPKWAMELIYRLP